MWKEIGAIILTTVLVTGCSSDKPQQHPQQQQPIKQEVKVEKPKQDDWALLPASLNDIPGIGASRVEFAKNYGNVDSMAKGIVVYNGGVMGVTFVDEQGYSSDNTTARATTVTMTNLSGQQMDMLTVSSAMYALLPSDHTELQVDEDYNDEQFTRATLHGTSAMLAKVFPMSGGNFTITSQWLKPSQTFNSFTVRIGK
ncbi:MAG: hypothetical protein K6G55_08685 [Selenomonadaceae bacterium]|nr:hypothetical protein [Selenomonadaceae bacterium]